MIRLQYCTARSRTFLYRHSLNLRNIPQYCTLEGGLQLRVTYSWLQKQPQTWESMGGTDDTLPIPGHMWKYPTVANLHTHSTTCSARLDRIYIAQTLLPNTLGSQILATLYSDHKATVLKIKMDVNNAPESSYWKLKRIRTYLTVLHNAGQNGKDTGINTLINYNGGTSTHTTYVFVVSSYRRPEA